MTTKAIDASKYTVAVDQTRIARWRDLGVGLVIIQAHPPGYGRERSLEIMRACHTAEMPWDTYIYEYLGYDDWLPGALQTMDEAAGQGLVPRKVWLDVEDVDSGKGWSAGQRSAAVVRDLGLCDAWVQDHGLPRTGIYSAQWYWGSYMGGTAAFSDRELWAAQYDNIADTDVFTPFGGWDECRIKQYAGSQPDGTDLDVLSEGEEAELFGSGGEPEPEPMPEYDQGWQDKKETVVQTAGELLSVADQLLAEANRPSGPRKSVIRRLADPELRARAQKILS